MDENQLMTAKDQGIEKGRTVAIDSTVTESDIKPPCDSDLLASSVKEICRLLERGQTLTATPLYEYTHHNRAVKDAARKCIYAGKEERHQHYKKLLQLTRKSRKVLIEATVTLANARQQGQCLLADDADKWQADVDHLLPLVDAIVSQTERRVFKGEKVPAQEKVVSLYEPHTDIIVKDRRQVQYGHKLNLVQGKSRLILDLVIEEGNPADSDQFIPMMERQKEIYGRVPRQTSGDGGYACRANLEKAKAMGISDVAFNKKRGLEVEEMTKSQYVYKTLFRFRAGIEAGISWLKRCFGLSRCHCKSSERFDSHCWLSVVCYNLVILARHPAPS
ncbi:transposase [Endozoicomonas sp. SCSIO W0465]|uniref:transposase n=1 Tax=Endozoicomonas sp. SCSIO W0465 TaxID=2918516 RepID=UPI002075927D|nr:transposase [Endozoicomonas sp. SCSIO W0465]USE38189.1 transposase [Endozoicomonas sp. SCSIO W0465]